MTEQEQKDTSLEYFYQRIIINFEFNSDTYISIHSALNEANKMYAEEIANAFIKGYEEGVNYTDGLISDERFPF